MKSAIKEKTGLRTCENCDRQSEEECFNCPVINPYVSDPVEEAPQRVWTKKEIREKLQSDDRWVIKGLLTIYRYQTEDEKSMGATKHDNGVGFNGLDAPFMSSLAEWYKEKGSLTQKQMLHCRKTILKYAGQLARIANEEVE